ncbi:MAG: 4'-phosphopantetheinyl transferase superfamily protein [Alloprevotella sp.]|nr:4'-phosphopantetheinyl transferase superfamily protein [Alloprevotella sp.]
MPRLTLPQSYLSEGAPHLLLWRIEESEEALCRLLPADAGYGEAAARRFKGAERRLEWLATRVLFHEAFGPDARITCRPSGRPTVEGATGHISISHSHRFVAIATSDYPVGVDIETWTPRALRVAPRFLSETEMTLLGNEAERRAVVLWSAKECAFKAAEEGTFNVMSEVRLTARPGKTLCASDKNFQHPQLVGYIKTDNFVITYTKKKNTE